MLIKARIRTGRPEFSIVKGEVWTICLKSRPENGKANAELINELSRLYKSVRIVSGKSSRNKLLQIE